MIPLTIITTRRHTGRDGELLRPALVRVEMAGARPLFLDSDRAADLAEKIAAAASAAAIANASGYVRRT